MNHGEEISRQGCLPELGQGRGDDHAECYRIRHPASNWSRKIWTAVASMFLLVSMESAGRYGWETHAFIVYAAGRLLRRL